MITELLPTEVIIDGDRFHLLFNSNDVGRVEVSYKNTEKSYLICNVSSTVPSSEDIPIIEEVLEKLSKTGSVLINGNYSITITELKRRVKKYVSETLRE